MATFKPWEPQRNKARVQIAKHVINCNVKPRAPAGLYVVENSKCGKIEWNPTRFRLYFPSRRKRAVISGSEFIKALKALEKSGGLILNACVLDYLFAHPELIPDSLKGKRIHFWGTFYRHINPDTFDYYENGIHYIYPPRDIVRFLFWNNRSCKWDREYSSIDGQFYFHSPAAILISRKRLALVPRCH